ncbi:MAG: hypothetical protein ACOYNF_05315 [Rhodoferax sp.]
MYIVAIAWLYVTVLMAATEASASNGTLLGAIITFCLYGVLPLGILVYIMRTPARRRAIKMRESADLQAAGMAPVDTGSGSAPDGHGKPAGDLVAPVRKEA